MIDAANATNIAITGRLRAAGLLTVAERVAKREELQLHHVIAIGGDPTGGHVALWRALAAEGKDAASLSAILGWPAAVIEASLARPKPKLVARIPAAPKSGPRAVRPAPVDVAAVIEAAVAPLRAEVAALRQELTPRPTGPSKAELHFARYGAAGEVVREMREEAGEFGTVALHVPWAFAATDALDGVDCDLYPIEGRPYGFVRETCWIVTGPGRGGRRLRLRKPR